MIVPRHDRLRIARHGFNDRGRHFLQFARLEALDAVHFIDWTNDADVFPADHEQPRVLGMQVILFRGDGRDTENMSERRTDHQLAAHVC